MQPFMFFMNWLSFISLWLFFLKLSPISHSLQIHLSTLPIRTLFLIWATGTSWETWSNTLVKSSYNHKKWCNLLTYGHSQKVNRKKCSWWVHAGSCWPSLSLLWLHNRFKNLFDSFVRRYHQVHWYKDQNLSFILVNNQDSICRLYRCFSSSSILHEVLHHPQPFSDLKSKLSLYPGLQLTLAKKLILSSYTFYPLLNRKGPLETFVAFLISPNLLCQLLKWSHIFYELAVVSLVWTLLSTLKCPSNFLLWLLFIFFNSFWSFYF